VRVVGERHFDPGGEEVVLFLLRMKKELFKQSMETRGGGRLQERRHFVVPGNQVTGGVSWAPIIKTDPGPSKTTLLPSKKGPMEENRVRSKVSPEVTFHFSDLSRKKTFDTYRMPPGSGL